MNSETKYNIHCQHCGKYVTSVRSTAKFCSKECRDFARYKRHSKTNQSYIRHQLLIASTISCKFCSKEFHPKTTTQLYCSRLCNHRNQNVTRGHRAKGFVKKTCDTCGNTYKTIYPFQNYCSSHCRENSRVVRENQMRYWGRSDIITDGYIHNIMFRSNSLENCPKFWKANAIQSFQYWILHKATEQHLNEYRNHGIDVDYSLLQLINKVKLDACKTFRKSPCPICQKPIKNISHRKYCSNKCYSKTLIKVRSSKICSTCHTNKLLNKFYVLSKTNKDGSKRYTGNCIECAKARSINKNTESRNKRVRICPICQATHTRKGTAKYCSLICSNEAIKIYRKLDWQRQKNRRVIND